MLSKVINKAKRVLLDRKSSSDWTVPNPRASDIYLVSYPKSGNTWMRYLMAYAIWPEIAEIDLVEMAGYVPSFGLKHDYDMMLNPDSPCNRLQHRIIKEHAPYNHLTRKYIKRVIYIARDGRDAMVSYWHFCNQRDGTAIPFSKFIEISAKPEHSYGPWKAHVTGWVNAPLEAKLVLRYEDLLSDTAGALKQALEFAKIEVTEAAISNAVERASFNSMRKLEKTKGFNLEMLKTVEFVRKGKSGSWPDVFGPGDLEAFGKFHGGCIPELGYSW